MLESLVTGLHLKKKRVLNSAANLFEWMLQFQVAGGGFVGGRRISLPSERRPGRICTVPCMPRWPLGG